MRRGKECAQAAHAAMAFLTKRLKGPVLFSRFMRGEFTKVERMWMEGSFIKVCVRVDSEEALMEIHQKAIEAELEVHLITDAGKTEFHGEPTRTCLAIGPNESDRIDAVTGDLKLL